MVHVYQEYFSVFFSKKYLCIVKYHQVLQMCADALWQSNSKQRFHNIVELFVLSSVLGILSNCIRKYRKKSNALKTLSWIVTCVFLRFIKYAPSCWWHVDLVSPSKLFQKFYKKINFLAQKWSKKMYYKAFYTCNLWAAVFYSIRPFHPCLIFCG